MGLLRLAGLGQPLPSPTRHNYAAQCVHIKMTSRIFDGFDTEGMRSYFCLLCGCPMSHASTGVHRVRHHESVPGNRTGKISFWFFMIIESLAPLRPVPLLQRDDGLELHPVCHAVTLSFVVAKIGLN
jgi:hypothetical protein